MLQAAARKMRIHMHSINALHSMNGERKSDKYSTLIDVALKKCFEQVTETLKDLLIELMSTAKDVLA
ncbi:hypothetical protein ACOME3_007553 [Neoechinorhynchus agilis]